MAYLKDKGILSGEEAVQFDLLKGGVSNRTVKIDFNSNSWVLKQALNKLRVKGDWHSAPDRIYYEAEALRWFHQHLPGISPQLVYEDKPAYILGMEAVAPPFGNLKDLLLEFPPDPRYFEEAGKLLGSIHFLGKNESLIPEIFYNTQFYDSLRVDPYYKECVRREPKTSNFFTQLIADSKTDRFTLTHGDFSPKNLLVKDEQLILLDHEVVHFGDGTFDIGFFVAHLFSKANYRKEYREKFLEGIESFFIYYSDATGVMEPSREQRAVKHSIGCILARVLGLSQLEYLSPDLKYLQKSIAMSLISKPPTKMSKMVSSFKSLLNRI